MYIKEHCTGANCIVGLPAVQIKCYQSKLDKLHLHSVQKCTEVYMNTVCGDVRSSYYRVVGYSLLLSTLAIILCKLQMIIYMYSHGMSFYPHDVLTVILYCRNTHVAIALTSICTIAVIALIVGIVALILATK